MTHELGWMDEWAQNMPSWNYAKNVEYVFGRWPKSVRRNRINGPVRPGEDVDAAEHDRPEDGQPE